jgi:hypothetical protein
MKRAYFTVLLAIQVAFFNNCKPVDMQYRRKLKDLLAGNVVKVAIIRIV